MTSSHRFYDETDHHSGSPVLLRRRSLLALTAGSLALAAASVRAQAYPSRPVRFIVPYAPGGGTDLVIRILQDPLSKAFGQPIIVENKAGAAGAIGAREVARAHPDGYTFLVSNTGPNVILPLFQKDAGYDPVKDFAPVTTLGTTPIVLIAHPSVPATDTASFIDWARQQKSAVAYGSGGAGSIGHLAGERFAKMAGAQFLHVPYRGQAPTITAILGNEIPVAFTTSSTMLLANIKAGKIRLIGIGWEQQTPLVPGGQPIARVLRGYTAGIWQGVLAPAGTPEAIVNRVADEIRRIISTPEVQDKFASGGYAASTNSPAQFAEMIAQEVRTWATLIAERGIKGEN